MVLFVYCPHPDDSWVALMRKGKPIVRRAVRKGTGGRGDILKTIDSILVAADSQPSNLRGIVVCTGPGHFTYLRTSIAIANTLGWALQIPVLGLEVQSQKEFIAAGLVGLSKMKAFIPVVPAYGKEPNITKSPKS